MTPASLAQLFNTALVFGALALAFRDLARRPWVHFRLNRRAARALAPAWCLLGAASVLAALLFPAGQPGYWRLLYQWAVLPAGTLLMAMLFLEAGSVWAWRAGLRGRGFGWLRPFCWFEARGVSWRWAAVLASAAWALGHAGLLVPGWAKFLQIFAAGLLLGWVQRRWGVALAIAVHLSLNVGVFLYAPLLAPR
ncbi:MAG: hypothetical protein NTW86_17660 [Candidatus Sumerlaeota bacterium]|nr:hypothetical protein [Candidatus Sumerlaeota bacterium]